MRAKDVLCPSEKHFKNEEMFLECEQSLRFFTCTFDYTDIPPNLPGMILNGI